MTLLAIADTHAFLWYLYDDPRLSTSARTVLETAERTANQIGISTITLAEILYLIEKGRIIPSALDRALQALDSTDASVVEMPFDRTVLEAMRHIERADVPDLPDRIIAATALVHQVPVISRDRKIVSAGIATIW